MLKKAAADKNVQSQLWTVCSRDPLFYFNVFAFTYDPRLEDAGLNPAIPFITYNYQDDALLTLMNAIGKHDVGIEKSRDMGASWMCLLAFEWFWHFRKNLSFMLMSRKEELVDNKEDYNALFPKIDFIHKHQPAWLAPRKHRSHLMLKNLETGSVMTGLSTTGSAGAGGRCTAALVDEFGLFKPSEGYSSLQSVQHTTKCRIMNSTYRGQFGAYYDTMEKMKKEGQCVLRLHWSQHPVKSRGLYRAQNGRVEFIDKNYVHPKGYEFVFDGTLRSPYYDGECKRTPIPTQIAEDLDINPAGAASRPFDKDVLDRHIAQHKLPPFVVGNVEVRDDGTISFAPMANGNLKLWLKLGPDDSVGPGDFVVSADIAAGTGASDSAITGANRSTGEKVLEYLSNRIVPLEFANLVVAIAKWFNNAFLIWEKNGPVGLSFGKQVQILGYPNIYYRQDEKKTIRKPTDQAGWHMDDDTKGMLFSRYQQRLAKSRFINHSESAVLECGNYIYTGEGGIEHKKAATSLDPSGRSDNHGDICVADALACWVVEDRPMPTPEIIKAPPAYLSDEWREAQRLKKEQEATDEDW